MKLTRASSYALHSLAYLASREGKEKEPVPSHKIAAERQIPERFLLKVLKPLAGVGILRSVKGPNGGYVLAKPVAKITFLDVVEAVEGPIRGSAPLSGDPSRKADGTDRRLEEVCNQSAELLRKHLGKVSLSSLLAAQHHPQHQAEPVLAGAGG